MITSPAERLRRLDESIARALRSKSALVAELLGLAPDSFAQMAELAVADTLGQVGECGAIARQLQKEQKKTFLVNTGLIVET